MIHLRIYGEPAPQGSKKHVGNGRLIESSKKLAPWRRTIIETCEQLKEEPIDQPVTVRVDFFMPKPKKPKFSEPATPPDTDKLQRALGDGLEQGGVIKNDSRITRWEAAKKWADETNPPGAEVYIITH